MRWYFLGAVKNFYLSQVKQPNDRDTVKSLFENIFHILSFNSIMVLDGKLMLSEKDLLKIKELLKYYVLGSKAMANMYPVNFKWSDVKEVESYNNDYILDVYTKNFVKPSENALKESIEKKMGTFRKHVHNLKKINQSKKILSFDFEYSDVNVSGITEVGMTIYYPQIDSIDSYHYIIENKKPMSKRRKNLGKEFCFGETEKITINKAMHLLSKEIESSDFILGHDLINEFNIMGKHPDWKRIIDTKYCDVVLNKRDRYFSLENILKFYGVKTAFLHNAGNDAAYVMDLTLRMLNQKRISLFNKKAIA
tara:strand:- start:117 stop:1040 length:924 start_codon:yes stop_codon:yes gene_type:complete